MKNRIFNLLIAGKSIFLVGPTDSGKSWFAEKELVPFLFKKGLSVLYFYDCNQLPDLEIIGDCAIIDEVEVLQDKEFLGKAHPNEKPYYSDEHLSKVKEWFNKLHQIKLPCVYIVTRNGTADIQNFIKTIKKTDWDGRVVESMEFRRE